MSKKEVTAEDYLRQMPSIDPGVEKGDIETVTVLRPPEVELELFMQELVTVLVHESTDPNVVPVVEVSVNGRRQFIPRNVPMPVKRMFVERLARAKKTTITQNLDPRLGEQMNRLHRHRALDYPFSVIEDKNPKGAQWLKDVLADA